MANSFYFIQEPDQNGMYIVDGSETVFYIAEDDASAVYLVEGDGVPYNQFKALQDQVNGIIISNGATRFTALTDAPSSYAGHAGQSVVVNGTETGVTFQTIVAGDPQLRSDVMAVSAYLQSEIVAISSQAGNATISLVAGTSGVLQGEINGLQAFDAQVAGVTGSFATVSALNMESAARAAADALLTPLTTVAAISSALVAADASEAATRAAADSALSAAVATASGNLAGSIAGEAAARSAADALLTPLATTASVSAGLDARITTNTNAISNIQTWDSQLATITGSFALNSLVSSVSAGLSGAINSEAGIRAAADANLQSQIDALTTSDISRSEVAAISAGLDSRITTNTTSISNIQTWDSQLAAVTGSFATVSYVGTVSGSLSTAIAGEASQRAAADLLLTPITTTAAISAGLDARITTNTTSISNIQTFDSQVAGLTGSLATTSYVNTVSGNLVGSIAGEANARSAADTLLTPLVTTANLTGALQGQITVNTVALQAITGGDIIPTKIQQFTSPISGFGHDQYWNLTWSGANIKVAGKALVQPKACTNLLGPAAEYGHAEYNFSFTTAVGPSINVSDFFCMDPAGQHYALYYDHTGGSVTISVYNKPTWTSQPIPDWTTVTIIGDFPQPTITVTSVAPSGTELTTSSSYLYGMGNVGGDIFTVGNISSAQSIYQAGEQVAINADLASISAAFQEFNTEVTGLTASFDSRLTTLESATDDDSAYALTVDVAGLTGNLQGQITTNTSNIATNTANIATNTANIAANSTSISNIQTFDSQVAGLTGGTWVALAGAQTKTGTLTISGGNSEPLLLETDSAGPWATTIRRTDLGSSYDVNIFNDGTAGGGFYVNARAFRVNDGVTTYVNATSAALTVSPATTINNSLTVSATSAPGITFNNSNGTSNLKFVSTAGWNAANQVGLDCYLQNVSGASKEYGYLIWQPSIGTSGGETTTIQLGAMNAGTLSSVLTFLGRDATFIRRVMVNNATDDGSTALQVAGNQLIQNSGATLTMYGTANSGERIIWNATSGTVYNFLQGHNWWNAGAWEIGASSALGGTTFTSPSFTLHGATGNIVIGGSASADDSLNALQIRRDTANGGKNCAVSFEDTNTNGNKYTLGTSVAAVSSGHFELYDNSSAALRMRIAKTNGNALFTSAMNISGATTIAGTTIVNNSSTATPFKMTGDRNGSLAIRAENVSVSGSASTGFVAANAATSTSLLLNGSGQATDPNALVISQLGANPIIIQQNGAETFRHTGTGNIICTGSENLSGSLSVGTSATIAGTLNVAGTETVSGSLYVAGTIYQNGNPVTGGTGNILSQITSTVNITAATTLDASSFGKLYIVTTGVTGVSAGNYTVNLPSVSGNAGKIIGISIDSGAQNVFTFQASGSEMIDGASQRIMWAGESAFLESNGTNWHKVAGTSLPMNCYLWKDSAQSTSSGVRAAITFNNCKYANPPYMNDVLHYQIICPRPGTYVAESCWTNSSGTNPQHAIFKNDITVASNQIGYAAGLSSLTPVCCLQLAKGDTILSAETITSAGAIYVESTHDYICFMRVCEIPTW